MSQIEHADPAVVMDHGSALSKVGFAGNDTPLIFPSIVGRPEAPKIVSRIEEPETFLGDDALEKRDILELTFPVRCGIVRDWNSMERLWDLTFDQILEVSPENRAVLLTDSPQNSRDSRERMTSIMFETFNVGALFVSTQPVLSLYASGRTTGVVLHSGHGVTHSVTMYEGYELPHSTLRMELGGSHITNYLEKILAERVKFPIVRDPFAQTEILRNIKESFCYVSDDYGDELNRAEETPQMCERPFTLPDGSVLRLGSELFRAPEIFFKPSFIGLEYCGAHEMLFNTMHKSDIDLRRDFYQNIILSGGSTMFEGIASRLTKELRSLVPKNAGPFIRVWAPSERNISSWIGGSIMASLSTFQTMWISKEDYGDSGPSIVHRRCF